MTTRQWMHIPRPLAAAKPSMREILIAGLPAAVVAAICLSFFVTKPFTVDDPIFLKVAAQASRTPLRPLGFELCWESEGEPHRASQYMVHAPLMGYVLIPAVSSRFPERTGHLLQTLILMLATVVTAALALRCGLSREQAFFAAALTAASPAVLGLAGTVMPDILALLMTVLGVERTLAWGQNGGWWRAGEAVIALGLAPLARPHLVLLFPICGLLLIPDVSPEKLRMEWRGVLKAAAFSAAALAAYVLLAILTRDPAGTGFVLHSDIVHTSLKEARGKVFSFGVYLALTTPFVLGALFFMLRDRLWRWAVIPCVVLGVAGGLLSGKETVYFIAAAGPAYLALLWVGWQLWKERTGFALALAAWAIVPVATALYLFMSPKYLVPSAPAYALFLVMMGPQRKAAARRLYAGLAAAGIVFGVMIVSADAREARVARAAVERWAPALTARGDRVLFQGQWGFQWYAEKEHAGCFDPSSAVSAHPGDWVMVGVNESFYGEAARKNLSPFPQRLYPHSRLVDTFGDESPGGVVLSVKYHVGFFFDTFGHLPWAWVPAGALRYELWHVD